MVIGKGMIAKAFARYEQDEDVLIFASGVSNSSEKDARQFFREQQYLAETLRQNANRLIVYFSTCSIGDKEVCGSPYVLHKLHMERLIKNTQARYLIVRLPQVVGKSLNRTTLVNFLHDSIASARPFTVWKGAARNLIDVDDVVNIVSYIVEHELYKNRILNIAGVTYPVTEIVHMLERITDKNAVYSIVDKGNSFEIECAECKHIANELNIDFNHSYLERILSKYYKA